MRHHRPGTTSATTALVLAATGCGLGMTAPTPGGVASVAVTPDSVSLAAGNSQAFSARALTASGTPLSNESFYWSTNDASIVSVSQSGVVQAHQAGLAQISASAQGASGFAYVVVVRPIVKTVTLTPASDSIYAGGAGDTATFSAMAYDAAGHVVAGSPFLWSVNGPLVTVADGLVTGTNSGAGVLTVTATSIDSSYPSATATVSVIGHIAIVTVTPSYFYLSTSGSYSLANQAQLTAALTDTFGNNVTGQRALAWMSANPAVATVNNQGVVTAVSTTIASTQINATTPDGVSGSATLTVFP